MFSSLNIVQANAVNVENDIKGNLVIVGGALESSNKEVFDKYIELGGGAGKIKVAIIPAASSKPTKYSNDFKNDLVNRYRVKDENVKIIPIAVIDDPTTKDVDESEWIENGNKEEIAATLKDCSAIWFIGGDQSRITKTLLNKDGSNTKSLDELWDIYTKGAVIGGTSAGTAIMSDPMLNGGDSQGALANGIVDMGVDTSKYEVEPAIVARGLGFFKYGIVDQHFNKD